VLLKSEILLSLTIALATGCSQLSDMSKMKDTTQQMASTTDGMAATTAGMATTTSGMAQTTNGMAVTTNDVLAQTSDMYQDLRQGNSVTIRNQVLHEMEEATSLQKKISEAGVYFFAFEFQLWKGDARDNGQTLDQLYDCAMQEFTRILHDYLPDDLTKVDVTSIVTNTKMENLEALAATMHQVNVTAKPGALSMLDLIKNVLQIKNQLDNGIIAEASLKDWQREGLLNYQELVYMVQMRANFLPVMTLAQISKIGSSGKISQDKDFLSYELSSWNSDFSNINLEQLVTYTNWMNEADVDATFLQSVGESVQANKDVQKVYGNMKIVDGDLKGLPSAGQSARKSALTSFKSSYEAYGSIKN
jgi:hypothetical protein